MVESNDRRRSRCILERALLVRYLLDTAVFIWAIADPERLSKRVVKVLQDEDTIRELSPVSISEIAIKQAIGKLEINSDDVLKGIADLKLRILPYTAAHALYLFHLPLEHSDPFDRQLIVQALVEKIPVISSDKTFKRYKELNVVW
jgi:PIN domain nuclease of toxin-antitoxin system